MLDDLLPLYGITHNAEDGTAFMENITAMGYDSEGNRKSSDTEMEIIVVSTEFNPSLPDNRRFPAERDRKLNVTWTKRERELAERGVTVSDASALQRKVSGY